MHSLRLAPRPPIVAAFVLALALGLAAVASGAPVVSILTGPNGPTRDTTPSFTFSADGSATSVECSIDEGTPDYEPCTGSGLHSRVAPLADGDYTFRVRATDAIPEETVATREFTVDTAAPTLTLLSGPTGPITDNTPSFGFSGEAGATIECSVDQGTASYAPCSSEHTPSALADGAYTFRVRATDAAGNVTTRTRTFTVDTVAPVTTLDASPPAFTADASPSFEFSANEGSVAFACRLDGPTFSACSSPRSYGTLAEGAHSFAVRATDAAGNVGAEQVVNFTVDVTNPTLTIVSGPDGPTNVDAPTFGFQAENGVGVQCSVDQGSASYGSCSGAGSHSPPTLVDGTYTFRVRATDAAGNVTTRTRAFSVDTLAPATTIDSTPLGTTDDQGPSFQFSSSESGVSFECRLDGPTFSACSSPKSYGTLAEGAHSFAVRATDAAGNVGAEEVESFTIDLTNPTLAIVSGPEGATNHNDPSFDFDAEGGTVVACSIDQGTPSYGACTSGGAHSAGTLADGAYTFRVRATDVLGRVTEREQPFTVDTVTPTAAVGSGPAGPSNDASPAFAFSSNEAGVSFECRRDSEVAFAPCESPKAYANLPDGAHSFHVRASDAAGNMSAVVDRGYSIDTVAPTLSIGFGPTGVTSDDSPFFEFAAAGQSAVECSIDQGAPSYGACTSGGSHVVTQRLAAGAYTFRVRASDPAGNAVVATRSFTVATGPVVTPPIVTPPPTPPPPATPPAAPRLMSPFPLVRLSGQLTANGAKVKTLSVRAPAGSMVRVRVTPRCAKGASCPVKSSASKVGQKGLTRFKRLELSYRAGTTIEIRVSQAGRIGKYTRFTIRRGKGPQRLDRCLMPGTTRASACPAA